jgi:SNF2 family DNA or RNA helicase
MNTKPATPLQSPPSASAPDIPPLREHQRRTVELLLAQPHVCDWSDPGTGKTYAALAGFEAHRTAGGGPALVLAPKSILTPTWAADIRRFFPHLTYSVATAANRAKAFALKADVYITNHDAVTWIEKHWRTLTHLHAPDSTLIIDESTAYKNPNAQRSKAAKALAARFAYRELMSGTPNPNTVLELWHQAYLCDGGARLGQSYWKFRAVACEPVQNGPGAEMIVWKDKPGVEAAVYDLLSDIVIRHKFEECVDIPENVERIVEYELSAKAARIYADMEEAMVAELRDGLVLDAVHAASRATKLLQIASGAVYTSEGNYELIDTGRYELVMDLVEERTHSLIGFLWKHQRDFLIKEADRRGLTYGLIDGSVKPKDRATIVERFQNGELQGLFAHPQSAGHGLTLTKGVATIWASPTFNAEHYKQFFHRIYRTGQTQKTETIHIVAKGTRDERAMTVRTGKLSAMQLLLDLTETQ